MKVIKELKGHSGSQVLLVEDQNIFVRKHNNITRNLERFHSLSELDLSFPKILRQDVDYYDMEYIPNLDIKHFLLKNQIHRLATFIKDTIHTLSSSIQDKDYTRVYYEKLKNIDFSNMIFNKDELIDRLPKILPSSAYHGDLTLENILYNVEQGEFVLIDPLTTEYDSYIFDLAKLRQDIECKWFVRHDRIYIDTKLQSLSEELESEFEHYSNCYILILMLLRVLPYTRGSDQQYIINEANKLWK